MRTQLEDNSLFQPVVKAGMHWGLDRAVLAGPITLTRESAPIQHLDNGGAIRIITLPAAEKGLWFIINNFAAAAFAFTINDPVGPTTKGTIATAKAAMVYSDGVTWFYIPFA